MGDGRYGHLHTFPVFRPQDFRVAMGRWLGEFILRKNVSKHGQTYFKHIFASNEAFQTHPIIPNLLTNQSCQAWHLSNSSLHFDETCACFFLGGFHGVSGFFFCLVLSIVELSQYDDDNSARRLKLFSSSSSVLLSEAFLEVRSHPCLSSNHRYHRCFGKPSEQNCMFNRI